MKRRNYIFFILLLGSLTGCFPPTQRETMDEEITELRGTEWSLKRPNDLQGTLKFDLNMEEISGFNGCNEYAGEVDIQNYQVEFENFVSTERFCAEKDEQEQEFMFLLSKVTDYRATKNRLYLSNRNENLLTFERVEE